jgi:hypothetical protein
MVRLLFKFTVLNQYDDLPNIYYVIDYDLEKAIAYAKLRLTDTDRIVAVEILNGAIL